MNQFLSSLVARAESDGVHWTLWLPLIYRDEELGMVTVPIGFQTDGGSIPGLFTNLISPTGQGFRAFVIHDWLYGTQTTTRQQADRCLLRALRACNFNDVGEDVIYDAVRIGGEIAWLEDSKHLWKP